MNYQDLLLYRDTLGESGETITDLSANENKISGLSKYPDPYNQKTLQTIINSINTEYGCSLNVDNALITIGAEETMDLTMRAFSSPGDNIVIQSPKFGLYDHYANINEVNVINNPVTIKDGVIDMQFDMFTQLANEDTKIIYIVNPGNPIPIETPKEKIKQILRDFDGIVVVDEAYIDFLGSDKSFLQEIHNHDNLLVVHTLSKGNGLAGARIGYIFGDQQLIDVIKYYKSPYSTSQIIDEFLGKYYSVIDMEENKSKGIEKIQKEKQNLIQILGSIPTVEYVIEGDTNFIVIKMNSSIDCDSFIEYLLENQIIIGPLHQQGGNLHNMIRVSIGTPEENTHFLNAITYYSHRSSHR